jgi:hypothetical protein
LALKDFTEASTTVSLTMSAAADLGFGNVDLNSGPKIFNSWTTGNGNSVFTMTLGGLSTASGITYDLIVYSDWWWNNGDNLPVTQTVGSGLGGTVYLNHIKTGTIGIVPGLVEDTSTVAANDSTQGNWIRITGLTPDGSGNLAFNMGGQNAALNGFQLVQVDSVAADTTAPTPNPMTFASPPAALDQTSITMTVTTASDPSGVEYFFECTAGGGHSSAWQDSPTYTDTGLTAATEYSYRVRARDKSAVQTATAWSATASATTTNTPYGTWSGGAAFDGDANNDGVDNGMAWLLGAADLSENAAGKLPKATHNGSNLRLTFRCLKSTMRGGVVLKVQYSSDMGLADPWTSNEAAVPDEDATVNGVVFDTSDDGDYIHVIAEIPAAGAKLFARLSAVVAP